MEYTIRNEKLNLTAGTKGAELHELNTADGRPLLWDAKPEIWPKHAPVCFPWCGALDGHVFEDQGREYRGEQRHGFVWSSEHELEADGEHELRFAYGWPGDDQMWPWAFRFETIHVLDGNRVVTTCTAENQSGRDMPVQMGFHPAFRCPFAELPDSKLEDYQVRFENGTVIALHAHLFDLDSMCFPRPGAWARLEHKATGRFIQVDTAGFDFVLLWSKPGRSGFVCMEPWSGYPGPGRVLTDRPGTVLMAPGERKSWKLIITAGL